MAEKPTPDINEILARPGHKGCSQRGADMGRASRVADGGPGRLRLQRLRWVDHDYDAGGAYWGGGSGDFIWCAFDVTPAGDLPTAVFVRATTRPEAARRVLDWLKARGADGLFTLVGGDGRQGGRA